jgi:penicillin-binding protein 1C
MSELSVLRDSTRPSAPVERVLSAETAALISHVLSDPDARSVEFGRDSVLNLPVQTAVKTGTSSDYRDAWTVGFDSRFTVGIWMGNLDQTPTRGVTGAIGPALLLRSVFALLNRDGDSRPLYLSPRLTQQDVCVPSPRVAAGTCITRQEWFDPLHPVPGNTQPATAITTPTPADLFVRLRQPTDGLELAWDPRLPPSAQAYRFLLDGIASSDAVTWTIDGATTHASGDTLIWPVKRGSHQVGASVHRDGVLIAEIAAIEFHVR